MMTKPEIVELIRNQYDPVPGHWRSRDNWDDGAEDIADQILASVSEPEPVEASLPAPCRPAFGV